MNSHGYQCECCSFNFSYYICNRYIDKKEAEIILGGERIILDGFSTNSGHVFSSIPVLDEYSIRLDNTVDYISGIGRIVVGNKSFTDSEQPHKLRIQRIYNGWKSHTNLTHPGKYFRPSKVKIMRPTSPK